MFKNRRIRRIIGIIIITTGIIVSLIIRSNGYRLVGSSYGHYKIIKI